MVGVPFGFVVVRKLEQTDRQPCKRPATRALEGTSTLEAALLLDTVVDLKIGPSYYVQVALSDHPAARLLVSITAPR